MGISILAPTRGATTPWLARKKLERHFNPRSREESDDEYEQYTLFSVAFQSTLPRGERLYKCSWQLLHEYFNPRSREGSDYSADCSDLSDGYFNPRSREGSDINDANGSEGVSISIHAPARGATRFNYAIYFCFYISIHAPARGATRTYGRGSSSDNNFNPRSREGSDVTNVEKEFSSHYFNPRSREGSDDDFIIKWRSIFISIHAPARGATKTLRLWQ